MPVSRIPSKPWFPWAATHIVVSDHVTMPRANYGNMIRRDYVTIKFRKKIHDYGKVASLIYILDSCHLVLKASAAEGPGFES